MEAAEEVDLRVQAELEKMNGASEEINRLQNELDEARNRFRATLSSSSQKLDGLLKRNKNSIQRSRTYYEARAAARKAQADAQRAAVLFRRSSSVYLVAKETVELAEKRLEDKDVEFDEAWQEMLNHNTMKMLESEKEKVKSDLEHHRKSSIYMKSEQLVAEMERKQRRSIQRSKSYYDVKAQLELQLEQQKQNVDDLQTAITAANARYKHAMAALEQISEDIHSQRRRHSSLPVSGPIKGVEGSRPPLGSSLSVGAEITLPPGTLREPGVGCEAGVASVESLETEIEKHLASLRSMDDICDDGSLSSDVDSVYSFDSAPLPRPSVQFTSSAARPDATSLLSESDSAIHSPKSGTLERGLTAIEHCEEEKEEHPPHCPLKRSSALGASLEPPAPLDSQPPSEALSSPSADREEASGCSVSRSVSDASMPDGCERLRECSDVGEAETTFTDSNGSTDEPDTKSCSEGDNSSASDEEDTPRPSESPSGFKCEAPSLNLPELKNLILDPAKLQQEAITADCNYE